MKTKTILITGAGSGIGHDAAIALAKRGHKVFATTFTIEQSENLKNEIGNLPIETFKLDITDSNEQILISNYEIDVLINNAGIGETGPLAEIPMERVRANFETNVFGTLAVTQIALQQMMKRESGTVITVSSTAGRIPRAFLSPYSMTKYALSGGFAAMREEMHQLFPNIHIALIEPGAFATGFNKRMMNKKYEWLDNSKFFSKLIPKLKKSEEHFK